MPPRKPHLESEQIALISKALSDPHRFALLRHLAETKETPTCSGVCGWLGLSPATVTHHLKELEGAGLLTIERQGKFARIGLRRDMLNAYAKCLAAL